jgi:hypothetical protein
MFIIRYGFIPLKDYAAAKPVVLIGGFVCMFADGWKAD